MDQDDIWDEHDDTRDAFLEAVVTWRMRNHTRGQAVVDAACNALVAGLDSPALRDLAGLYPDTPEEVLRLTVDDVVTELRITVPAGPHSLGRFALRRQAQAMRDGRIGPRVLAQWAHSIDETYQSADHRRFVGALWEYEELDDLEDFLACETLTRVEATAALDADVRRMAHAVLAEPS